MCVPAPPASRYHKGRGGYHEEDSPYARHTSVSTLQRAPASLSLSPSPQYPRCTWLPSHCIPRLIVLVSVLSYFSHFPFSPHPLNRLTLSGSSILSWRRVRGRSEVLLGVAAEGCRGGAQDLADLLVLVDEGLELGVLELQTRGTRRILSFIDSRRFNTVAEQLGDWRPAQGTSI